MGMMTFAWKSQAKQHSPHGHPGISYQTNVVNYGNGFVKVEYLLYYSKTGILSGIFYYYPHHSPFQKAGSANLFVRPAKQRKGIGTLLILEARKRWSINFSDQTYTLPGLNLVKKLGLLNY